MVCREALAMRGLGPTAGAYFAAIPGTDVFPIANTGFVRIAGKDSVRIVPCGVFTAC
jgi:hypothetical protein